MASCHSEDPSGVPKDSVLGPILFLVDVNNLPEGIESFLSKFADDAKIMRWIKTEDSMRLQDDLDKIKEGSNNWLLEFNQSKCKVMKISVWRSDTRYHLGGKILQESGREKKTWGLISCQIDISPKAHIKRISSAAYARLSNNITVFRNLCKESFRTSDTTYFRQILEYVAPAWSPYQVKHKTKLEKIQRYATRLVPELRGMSHEERLRELNLTSHVPGGQ
ncbi:uncharacterized protein [Procambarus clarkii]|uniref:uncharacterized protein n=1 Tax=Procambarus clarkii TaxID=6728 RepID=UPI003743A7E8